MEKRDEKVRVSVPPQMRCIDGSPLYFYVFLHVPLLAQVGGEWTSYGVKLSGQTRCATNVPSADYIPRRAGFEGLRERWNMQTYGYLLNTFLFTCHLNNTISRKKKVWGEGASVCTQCCHPRLPSCCSSVSIIENQHHTVRL